MSDENQPVIIDRSTKVTKEVHDVAEAIKAAMVGTKDALEDGWQPSEDMPKILAATYAKIPEAIKNFLDVKAEFKAEPVKASMAIAIPVAEGVDALVND